MPLFLESKPYCGCHKVRPGYSLCESLIQPRACHWASKGKDYNSNRLLCSLDWWDGVVDVVRRPNVSLRAQLQGCFETPRHVGVLASNQRMFGAGTRSGRGQWRDMGEQNLRCATAERRGRLEACGPRALDAVVYLRHMAAAFALRSTAQREGTHQAL